MEMMLRLVLSRRCEARVRGEGQTPVGRRAAERGTWGQLRLAPHSRPPVQ